MEERDFARDLKDHIEKEIRERTSEAMKRPKVMVMGDTRWGLLWGAVIVAIGVLLLLDRMGISGFDRIYRFWPMILVLFGVMNIVTNSSRGFGIVLALAGVALQLNNLGYLHLTWSELWPMAIIAVGILVMWGSLETRGYLGKHAAAAQAGAPAGDLRDTLHAVAVFGGCERVISSKNFRGGKATAVFGGIEFDFRDADIEGPEAVLEINCVFGGVEIRVPDGWHVYSRSLPVFGGYSDKSRAQTAANQTANAKTLVITGMIIFGGVEIKN